MAVTLKYKIFKSQKELSDFCGVSGNNVTTIVSISQDNSGAWTLFYT